jgi:hypothetical protein
VRLDDPFSSMLGSATPSRHRPRKDYADRQPGTTVRAEPLSPRCSRWVIGDFRLGTFRTRREAIRARRQAGALDRRVILLLGIARVRGERRP